MTVAPIWSVVVPVYERRVFLRECLESILIQDPGPESLEVLVIDNASPTPGIGDLVDEIAGKRVKFYRNERNVGLYRSMNKGVLATTGRFIHFLHEDDYVLPGFYREVVPPEHRSSNVPQIYHSHYLNLGEEGSTGGPPFFTSQQAMLERLVLGNPLQICSIVIDRRVFEMIGLFREDLPHTADWEFWMRAALRVPWIYNKQPLAVFRVHKKQDTAKHTENGRAIYDTRRLLDSFAEILPDSLKVFLPTSRRSYARLAMISAIGAIEDGDSQAAATFLREASILLHPTGVGDMLLNS